MARTLTEMTWPEVEAGLEDTDLVVVPTASIEQHGPHLPLSVDTIRAEQLGWRIATELDCFLAPVVRPGLSAHHMDFPGTITLDEKTFKRLVQNYCESLAQHGFTSIALFTSHGGNTDALDEIVEILDRELDAHVFVAGTRDGLMDTRTRTMDEFDVTPEESGAHAGAAETAFLLETNTELVRTTDGTTGFLGDISEVSIGDGIDAISENGVLGDPECATAEQGERLIEACATYFVDEIQAEQQELVENP
jgi:creatinine amidohydrolase